MSNREDLLSIFAVYLEQNTGRIRQDPEFAKWLMEEYRPIAGGWQY